MNSLTPHLWVERYGDYLYSIAVIRTRNKQVAEDIVQETLLFAYKSRDGFRGESTERTWLTAILNNKITDHFRKKDVLKEVDVYLSDTSDQFLRSFFESDTAIKGHWKREAFPNDWLAPVEARIQENEFTIVLKDCLSRLPATLSFAFTARHIDEKKSDEICKVLKITPSNYWVIMHRAKVLLRACLETAGFKN